jgi:hypothetical protein
MAEDAMKIFILRELRQRSAVAGKQRTWIADLSDDELWQIYLKLRAGESSRAVAKYIQERWKIKEKSETHSIAQGINKFRKRIADLLELQLSEDPEEKQRKQEESLNELEWSDGLLSLEKIVKLARERVARMLTEEEQGIRHPNLNRDMQALAALSKQLTKDKEFFLAHPNEDPVRKREEQIKDKKRKQQFDAILASLPDDGERIIKAADRFLELAMERAVLVAFDPETGTYEPVGEENE